jgi:hypothetical protein
MGIGFGFVFMLLSQYSRNIQIFKQNPPKYPIPKPYTHQPSIVLPRPLRQPLLELGLRQRILPCIHPRHTPISLLIAIPQQIPTVTVQRRIGIGILQQIPGSPAQAL